MKSLQQLQQAVLTLDWRLFWSGFSLVCLTMLALFASTVYNVALAESNTEMIMNAVILLFINDIDERVLLILNSFAPEWTRSRLQESRDFTSSKEHKLESFRKKRGSDIMKCPEKCSAKEKDSSELEKEFSREFSKTNSQHDQEDFSEFKSTSNARSFISNESSPHDIKFDSFFQDPHY